MPNREREREREQDHCKLTICNQIQAKKRKTHNGEKTTKNFNFTLCFSPSACTFSTFLAPSYIVLISLTLRLSLFLSGLHSAFYRFNFESFFICSVFPTFGKLPTARVCERVQSKKNEMESSIDSSNIISRMCFCFITNRFSFKAYFNCLFSQL